MGSFVAVAVMGILAAALLGPIPAVLDRARWPYREPRAALVLWQAVGLAGGLTVLGTAAAMALAPLGPTLWEAAAVYVRNLASGDLTGGLGIGHLILLAIAVMITAWLVGVLPVTIWRTFKARKRHRQLVDLVSRPWPTARPGDGRVLDHPDAAAYCLPGRVARGRTRIIFTTGALSRLDDAEVAAVLAHEDAHLTERHDLVALPFLAWVTAFPWFPGVRRARFAVATLLEMVADDRATSSTKPATLASALARMGSGAHTPPGSLPIDGGSVLERVHRLLDPPPRSWGWRISAYLLAIALVSVPINAVGASLY